MAAHSATLGLGKQRRVRAARVVCACAESSYRSAAAAGEGKHGSDGRRLGSLQKTFSDAKAAGHRQLDMNYSSARRSQRHGIAHRTDRSTVGQAAYGFL